MSRSFRLGKIMCDLAGWLYFMCFFYFFKVNKREGIVTFKLCMWRLNQLDYFPRQIELLLLRKMHPSFNLAQSGMYCAN